MSSQPLRGIYVHIPFCEQKCPYCDFYSVCGDGQLKEAYTEAVLAEMAETLQEGSCADTLYFGGGTPVLLGAGRLVRLIAAARKHLTGDAEITVEANPGAVDAGLLERLRGAGANRLSFGVQSGVPAELTQLGRMHTVQDAVQAVDLARCAGFSNLSADVMLGTPGQSMESLVKTLDVVASLGVQHVSAYLLKVEHGTPFAINGVTGTGEDLTADMYLYTVETLKKQGFFQYEVSNFAKPGFESRHNLNYWRCGEYWGFGAAAHSYINGVRFCHERDLDGYIKNPVHGKTVTDAYAGGFDEYTMLRLRLAEGLDVEEARRRYGISPEAILQKAQQYQKAGLLTIRGPVVALTPQGFLVSNSLIARLTEEPVGPK